MKYKGYQAEIKYSDEDELKFYKNIYKIVRILIIDKMYKITK